MGGPDTERLDIVDPTGRHLGTAARDEVHRDGLWHPVFHCLIVRSGPPARVVLQRRSATKAAFPGKLDLSATGHLAAGEAPTDGVRELAEELGVEVDPSRLVPLGVRLLVDDQGGEGRNRERVHAFLLADDRPLDSFRPAPGEVDAVVEVEVAPLLAALADPTRTAPARQWPPPPTDTHPGGDRSRGAREGETSTIEVRGGDLVDAVDGYWTVVLVMAERLANGLAPVAV